MSVSLEKRNPGIDIIKTIAVLSVISVHFFLNAGFYNTPVLGKRMFVMVFMRTLFMVCVPLFLITTGFLAKNKVLSKKYFFSVSRVLILYILSSIVCSIYKSYVLPDYVFSIKQVVLDILNFTGSNYAWYVEMYLGLFLIIPFLNAAYSALETKENKKILIFVMLFMSTIPTIFNSRIKILPFWWENIYPVTYYFIGSYLREYPIKIKPVVNILLFVLAVLAFSLINYFYNFGHNFKWSMFVNWGGYQNVITSTLLFNLFVSTDLSKMKKGLKYIFFKIADLSFCIYLVSYIFDSYAYPILNAKIPEMLNKLPYFFIMVLFVFCCSFVLSLIINTIYTLGSKIYKKARA